MKDGKEPSKKNLELRKKAACVIESNLVD